jgi:hypothetical protein
MRELGAPSDRFETGLAPKCGLFTCQCGAPLGLATSHRVQRRLRWDDAPGHNVFQSPLPLEALCPLFQEEDEMMRVHYRDEDPIDYQSEEERTLLEGIKRDCGCTVREVLAMADAIVLAEMDVWMDPIEATGEPFIFPVRGSPYWFSDEVPGPHANVNLREAWDTAQADAVACRRTLERDNSIEATLAVYKSSIRWAKFWSVRSFRPEMRIMFSRSLERLEEGLVELKLKAFQKGDLQMVEELGNV